jgi:hypothetical protein
MLKVGRDAEFDSGWFTSRYDLRLLAVYQCSNSKQDAEFVWCKSIPMSNKNFLELRIKQDNGNLLGHKI